MEKGHRDEGTCLKSIALIFVGSKVCPCEDDFVFEVGFVAVDMVALCSNIAVSI